MEGRDTSRSLVLNDGDDAGHRPDLAERQRRNRPRSHDPDEVTLRPGSVTTPARELAGALNNSNTSGSGRSLHYLASIAYPGGRPMSACKEVIFVIYRV